MPYKSIDELPDTVKSIPNHAKTIFMAAFNSAFSDTCKDKGDQKEQCSMMVAWGAVKQKYEQDKDGKWTEKKEETTQSIIRSSLSPPIERPKIDNGMWIPFLRNDMLADVTGKDGKVTRYRITKEAIDKGYKSFLGKTFDGNHEPAITGKVVDVKREGEFAYFKAEGLSPETLAVMNSVAYRGVSQSSNKLKSIVDGGENKVLELDGRKIAIITWPHTPGCPISSGCGLPIPPITNDEQDFSLYSSQNIQSVIKGDATTADYTKEQIKEMLKTMMDKPDMVDEGMKKMMLEMSSVKEEKKVDETKSNITDEIKTNSSLNTDKEIKETNENGGLKSTMTGKYTPEQLKDMALYLKENPDQTPAELKSTLDITTTPKEIDDVTQANATLMKSSLDQMRIQDAIKAEQKEKRDTVISELRSCVPRKHIDDMLARNVSTEVLQSTLTFARTVGLALPGAGVGTEVLQSSIKGQKKAQFIEGEEIYTKLGLTEKEFMEGAR